MHMTQTPPPLAALATREELMAALETSEGFRDFYEQTCKCSGTDPALVALESVYFSFTDGQGYLHENRRLDDLAWVGGSQVSLATLLAPQRGVDRGRIIHAIWSLETFPALKALISELACVVRYGSDAEGKVLGQVTFSDALLPMIESVERREYVLANGSMASDSITRTLGLRAKVFALDRARRIPIDEGSLFSRMTRSIAIKRS